MGTFASPIEGTCPRSPPKVHGVSGADRKLRNLVADELINRDDSDVDYGNVDVPQYGHRDIVVPVDCPALYCPILDTAVRAPQSDCRVLERSHDVRGGDHERDDDLRVVR